MQVWIQRRITRKIICGLAHEHKVTGVNRCVRPPLGVASQFERRIDEPTQQQSAHHYESRGGQQAAHPARVEISETELPCTLDLFHDQSGDQVTRQPKEHVDPDETALTTSASPRTQRHQHPGPAAATLAISWKAV